MSKTSVAILGSGIQGICAALALANKGYEIHLIDQTPAPMMRASLRNEGKIHLGFIYAKDKTFKTARLMLESSLSFANLIDSWIPTGIDWQAIRSKPFYYLVMRDSMMDKSDLFSHYEKVNSTYREILDGGHYLGIQAERLWRKMDSPEYINSDHVESAVQTEELALHLPAFRDLLVKAIDQNPRIRFFSNRRIEGISQSSNGFQLEGFLSNKGTPWKIKSEIVVNCLWENRLALDQQIGLKPEKSWVYRLKYRVTGALPDSLKKISPMTMTLGLYGDVVPFENYTYFSWYPTCRRGWSSDLQIPNEWELPCNGKVPPQYANALAQEVLSKLKPIIPGIQRSLKLKVDAGIVFCWGESDIDHTDSEFHKRFDIGVQRENGYFSIDTGKFCCAPLFAHQLSEML